MSDQEKPRRTGGRQPKDGPPARQLQIIIYMANEEQLGEVRAAANKLNLPISAWGRDILVKAAKRELRKKTS